jgi:peptide/nickel transport system permease protein
MSTVSPLVLDAPPVLAPATTGAPRWRWPRWRVAPVLAALFLLALALAAVAPHWFTALDPLEGDFLAVLQPPDAAHWFGTDRLGRDVWTRTVYGARYSLTIGLASTALAVLWGVLLGIGAGLAGRWLDEAIARLLDVISSFPGVLLAMLVVIFLGPGLANIAIAVGIAGVPKFGRIVRAQTLQVRQADYVTHAVIYGRSRAQVFLRHVLPNVLSAVPITATVYVGSTILATSGLSFLGLGPQPPTPEWGVMLAESRDVLRVAWWPGLFPGLAITLTVVAFTVLGQDLQRRFEGRIP